MIAFSKTIHEDLPVTLQLRFEFIDLVRPGKGITFNPMRQFAQECPQWLAIVRIEINENKAFPNLALYLRYTARIRVEVQQQIFARWRDQGAIERIADGPGITMFS